MRLYVCAVKDAALQAFTQPIFVAAPGVAIRSFQDEVNRQADNNQLNAHPEDFDLYLLSEYDDSTGIFLDNEPRLLTRGKEVQQP